MSEYSKQLWFYFLTFDFTWQFHRCRQRASLLHRRLLLLQQTCHILLPIPPLRHLILHQQYHHRYHIPPRILSTQLILLTRHRMSAENLQLEILRYRVVRFQIQKNPKDLNYRRIQNHLHPMLNHIHRHSRHIRCNLYQHTQQQGMGLMHNLLHHVSILLLVQNSPNQN